MDGEGNEGQPVHFCVRMIDTLDIWAPSDAKEGDNLPVLIYIHSGGFYEKVSGNHEQLS